MTARRLRGASLLEALVALAACALLGGAVAATGATLQRSRAPAAAHRVVSDLRLRHFDAIARVRSSGLVLSRRGELWLVAVAEDGDGDGLRTDDLRRGVDPVIEPARWTRDRWGVEPGFARGLEALRSPPPDDEPLRDLTDPVQFGQRDIVSCSPRGTMSAGTIYLTEGSRQFAVVACGPTSRLRVWEYDRGRGRWHRR